MQTQKFDMTASLGMKPLDIPPTLPESVNELVLERGVRVDGDFRWVTNDPPSAEHHQLPVELYLRELTDLDLRDAEVIFRFCSTHGMTHDCAQGWSDLGLTTVHGNPWASPMARKVKAAVEQFLQAQPDELGDQNWHERRVYHADEIRLRLARIRNVARTCTFLEGAITKEELRGLWDAGLDTVPDDLDEARIFVCRSLTAAMSSVHPVLAISDKVASRHSVSLFAGLALQIYNDIVVGARFRKCPRCGRLFVRHRSGKPDEDEQYQIRGDEKAVRFCSSRCAEADASRQYRARKRAKQLRDVGLTVAETADKMRLSKRDVELLLQAEGRDRRDKKSG